MGQTALVLLIVAAVVVLVVVGLVFAVRQRSGLRKLPPESRDRYARTWQQLETQFLENPSAAVKEADRTSVMILTERGATIHDGRGMPRDLREAREAASSDEGRQGTEGMRVAMLHYRRIVDDALGESARKETGETGRREVAS